MQTRRYAIEIFGLGVASALLILGFVWFVARRIDSDVESGLRTEGRALNSRLAHQVDQLLRQTLTRQDGAADPRLRATWRSVLPELEAWLERDASYRAVNLSFPEWESPIKLGDGSLLPSILPEQGSVVGPDSDGNLVSAFAAPSWSAPGDQIRAVAHLRPISLWRERGHVVGFVGLSALALGAGLFTIAALMIFASRAQIRLAHKEHEKATRLRAMGEVAGGIAHEVRNPLNGISLSVQYLEKLTQRGDRPPTSSDFSRIHIEVGKIRKIVDNFVKFARLRDLVVGPMDLGQIVDEILARRAAECDALRITRNVSKEGDLEGHGDREKLAEVLDTVIENALDAMRGKGQGELRIRLVGTRKTIRVTVRDTGDVLDENVIRNIFVPYFTTRDNALGLGMTIARTLVEGHGGTIEASAAQNGGCMVSITVPRRFLT